MSSTSHSDDQPQKRGWKDDALSIFLVVAAIVLGGMYIHDQWQASTLDEQMSRATQLEAGFAIDGANCQVNSTGLRGEVLVFDCGGLAAPKLAAAAAAMDQLADELVHFKRVVFVGVETQLHCSPEPTAWPDGCDRQPLPEIPE